MQKAYDNVFPANIAKTILDELEGFNPFNLLKPLLLAFGRNKCVIVHLFSYSFSRMPCGAKTAPWIKGHASSGAFKK
jgi:hypothetical protein